MLWEIIIQRKLNMVLCDGIKLMVNKWNRKYAATDLCYSEKQFFGLTSRMKKKILQYNS